MSSTPSSAEMPESSGSPSSAIVSSPVSPVHLAIQIPDATIAMSVQVPAVRPSDDDGASDVSMSAESDDSDDEIEGRTSHIILTQQPAVRIPASHNPAETSKKRKLSSDNERLMEGQGITHRAIDLKRIKIEVAPDLALRSFRTEGSRLPSDRSLLPTEIWHRVFTFTPPRALGRLLQVNKRFRAYLDSSSSYSLPVLASLSNSAVPARLPDAIWQSSRRLFRPWMPSPLEGVTELDMWRLACNRACQFCGKSKPLSPGSTDQWHSSPGEDGVRSIWPFAIRSCGSCLQQRSIKEIDLLLSSSVPSPLMAAIPFIILTNDLHVILAAALQQGQPPPDVQFGKYFFKPHVEETKVEFFTVKNLGPGAAEEWLKGLDDRGREKRTDASRWERWETSGGVQRMLMSEPAEIQEVIIKSRTSHAIPTITPNDDLVPTLPDGLSRIPVFNDDFLQPSDLSLKTSQPRVSGFAMNTPPRFDSPIQNNFSTYPPRPFQQSRHERTKEEVADLKAARKAEIERRCLLLEPPLMPEVLAHMASFKAALQIIKPFDDSAWELLRPRLMSQRDEARQREDARIAQTRIVQEKYDERRHQDIQVKEAKDVVDREWEDMQTPLRNRIGEYADELIRDGWNNGEKVTNDNSPKFAAEVLIHVRTRFYAEIAKDDAAARGTSQELKVDPPNGPFTQKLILENMKWVFDIKIKPHTEQYRKELFLCNGCENNFKFYGFEGVIQHYAAKHTSSLSFGSIVVHWRAEWPEEPPFIPEPDNAKSTFFTAPISAASFPNGNDMPAQAYGFGGYPAVSGAPLPPVQVQHPGYQPSPIPFYGHPQFGEQYPSQAPSFVQPPPFQGHPQGFQGPQYVGTQVNGYPPYLSHQYTPQGFDGHHNTSMVYDSPHPNQVYPVSVAEQSGQYGSNARPAGQIFAVAAPFQPPGQFNPGVASTSIHRTEAYKVQLLDIARDARELWNSTSGVKEMPGSVRVHVILFHILQRSQARQADNPPLTMIIDGLSNNKDMRPVRNINGLACRTCSLAKANEKINPHTISSKGSKGVERKLFSLPQLLNHFQSTHIETAEPSSWDAHSPPEQDWTREMVELPDDSKIAALAHAPGIDDHKIQLIMEALPESFRPPPQDEHGSIAVPAPLYHDDLREQPHDQLAPSRDNHEKYYATPDQSTFPDTDREPCPQYVSINRPLADESAMRIKSSTRRKRERPRDYQGRPSATYVERTVPSPLAPLQAASERDSRIRDDAMFYSELPKQYHGSETIGYRDRRRDESPELIPYSAPSPNGDERVYARGLSPFRVIEVSELEQLDHARHRGHDPRLRPRDTEATYPHENSHSGTLNSHPSRSHQSSRPDPVEAGSEDGELRPPSTPNKDLRIEADSAAERFLNELLPADNVEQHVRRGEDSEHRNDSIRARWEPEHMDSIRHLRRTSAEFPQEPRHRPSDVGNGPVGSVHHISYARSPPDVPSHSVRQPERTQPHHTQMSYYAYDDGRNIPVEEFLRGRPRSPETATRRFQTSSSLYRDERQEIHGNHIIPGRYGSIRMDNGRARSRSPVYVKVGLSSGQYHEQGPALRYSQQEPVYRTRSPPGPIEELPYERIPRPEYFRVYPDDRRVRQHQYEAEVEYVQVADPQGDYLIRRPVRREPDPVYTTYEERTSPRSNISEPRAPISRSDPAYYEEYDPRHPEPPPTTAIRQVRYQ